MNGVWQKAADRIRESLGQVGYETWIGPLNFVGLQDRTATLEAPNRFFRDWVNGRYLNLMRQVLSDEIGQSVEVKLILGKETNGHKAVNGSTNGNGHIHPPAAGKGGQAANLDSRGPSQRTAGHPQLNPRFTFAEFVVGSSNQFAHSAALAVASKPGEKYNPLFIYGGVGLGKTHLATAIGHHLWAAGSRQHRVVFMAAEVFMNELISSIRREKMGEFKEKLRRVDALILDDVHFMAGRERTQEEFFHTFNSLHSEGHQIVLTSDKVPRDIPELEERLRNRFESGLIVDIAAPDLGTRVAIVQKKAALVRLNVPSEVAMYIAQNVSSNVRELEGCLTRLAALTSLNTSSITIDFASQALCDFIRTHTRTQESKPDIEAIQRTVAEFFHIQLGDLKSKKRTQHIAFCRQVAMYLCRKITGSSFPIIGVHFSRDHSTVIHAFNLIQRRVKNDSAFRFSIDKIERELKNIQADTPPPAVTPPGGIENRGE
ncbi:MAG: chromosomal replication initiator protein DnaA [Deltaproteobacteria bacterium]|nr:chromosomal replication initiator protein DnaA [Deltaproteobacteria bacterium]